MAVTGDKMASRTCEGVAYIGSEKSGEEQAAIYVKRSRIWAQMVRVLVPMFVPSFCWTWASDWTCGVSVSSSVLRGQ